MRSSLIKKKYSDSYASSIKSQSVQGKKNKNVPIVSHVTDYIKTTNSRIKKKIKIKTYKFSQIIIL